MQVLTLLVAILLLATFAYWMGRGRSLALASGVARSLHSLPSTYGFYVALWCALPAAAVLLLGLLLEPWLARTLLLAGLSPETRALPPAQLSLYLNDVRNLAAGIVIGEVNAELQAAADHYNSLRQTGFATVAVVALGAAIAGTSLGWRTVDPQLRARNAVERTVTGLLMLASAISILTTVGIVLSLLFEAMRFFHAIPVTDFLFGLEWSPQTAIRADQVGSSGAFGAVPLFAGTMLISLIAMLVAAPIGLLAAMYMAEYADSRVRAVVKPALEILAGVPTVVYGFFAALTVAPVIRNSGGLLGLDVASESALAAGLVMGIMIIPFVSSLSDDVITAVPRALRDASDGLGATKAETIRLVIFPAALPGIVGGLLLAVSRAIGETMIVVMAAGLSANLTANPFASVTTVTVQIVTLLIGDQEFDSPKTLAAFALGLVLFIVTLGLNVVALQVVKAYREKYD